MKKRIWFSMAVFALGLMFAQASQLGVAEEVSRSGTDGKTPLTAGTIVVFDIPEASCSAQTYVCATPTGVDSQGTVVGYYAEADFINHAFYRLADGTITVFDEPEADCAGANFTCTRASAVNAAGTVAGWYFNGSTYKGFLRDAAGDFSAFEAPNAMATVPLAISSKGAVTGYYLDTSNSGHGFLLDTSGNLTTFVAPGRPYPSAVNSLGEVVGTYLDADSNLQGFLLGEGGGITLLNPAGYQHVTPVAIDDGGRIVGHYLDGNQNKSYSFIRDTTGNYTTFGVPGSTVTYATALDSKGTIIGQYTDAQGSWKGFYRLRDGTIGLFDPAGSTDTYPTGIGPQGEITGYFTDSDYFVHDFVRLSE
jgi:hypothetical protein